LNGTPLRCPKLPWTFYIESDTGFRFSTFNLVNVAASGAEATVVFTAEGEWMPRIQEADAMGDSRIRTRRLERPTATFSWSTSPFRMQSAPCCLPHASACSTRFGTPNKDTIMAELERLDDEYRYPYLAPSELKARLAKKAILYLPIGSLEWHNEHLPLGTDTLHAIELAKRLCRRLGGAVLPAFWWNTGGCHDSPVTYHMPEETYRTTLKNVCLGLAPIPARVLVLINGHGGVYQKDSPQVIADELNAEDFPARVVVADPYGLGTSSPLRIDHADTGETSFSLELIPQLVRMGRDIGPDLFSGRKPFIDRGQPSADNGRLLWEAYAADAAELIEKAYQGGGQCD
jgi:creatinine amidohydrolase